MRGYKTSISFICPGCRTSVTETIDVPEPYWTAERTSDMTAEDEIEITCSSCDLLFPAHVLNSAGHCEVTLDEYPETKISADHAFYDGPDDDGWVDYSIPDDPHAIFMDSYHHTGDLLADYGGNGAHLLNRMIFTQQVTALEAFLGDTLTGEVIEDVTATARLLSADSTLGREKFNLKEIASDKDFVKSHVTKYLKSVSYHNIPRVRDLYKNAFDIDLFEMLGPDEKDKLLKAIEYRHDCVHRNGYDKEGGLLEVFTKEYVQETADLMKRFVERIFDKIATKRLGDRSDGLDEFF